MTVNRFYGAENIECQWFSGTKLQKGHFHPDALQKFVEIAAATYYPPPSRAGLSPWAAK